MADEVECKTVVVGDSKCGKTSLVMRFTADTFTEIYTPTGFDKFTTAINVAGNRIHFTVWDTSGSAAYNSVRPLAYQDAQVFLLCFRISDPDSLDNAVNKWYPEIRLHGGESTPIILCGCQSDTRNDLDTISGLARIRRIPVTLEQALTVSRTIGAATYIETSAKNRSTHDVFEVAALATFSKLNKKYAELQRQNCNNVQVNGKPKIDLKTELKGRAKRCVIM